MLSLYLMKISIICFGKISIVIAEENKQNRPAVCNSAVNLLKNGTYLKISMYIYFVHTKCKSIFNYVQ